MSSSWRSCRAVEGVADAEGAARCRISVMSTLREVQNGWRWETKHKDKRWISCFKVAIDIINIKHSIIPIQINISFQNKSKFTFLPVFQYNIAYLQQKLTKHVQRRGTLHWLGTC
jgi:hypothetical protein